jgi:hydrogenase maturation protease
MKRIICVGNRYVSHDMAGLLVYERLLESTLPPDVQVIDGGLAGLNLLPLVEGAERVVFVDQVAGFQENGDQIVILTAEEVAGLAGGQYGHSAGLAFLLRALPSVCEGDLPHIQLVGIEGHPDENVIEQAAWLAIRIISRPAPAPPEVQNGNDG